MSSEIILNEMKSYPRSCGIMDSHTNDHIFNLKESTVHYKKSTKTLKIHF